MSTDSFYADSFYIERIQVDEGFLNGLDLRLGRGLTVVIGARGTGKTSLVELVRFCLDVSSFTEEAAQRGSHQAESVLNGGQVTVTLSNGSERMTVARSASDPQPRSVSPIPRATILAQGEIESVGAQSSGRMRLIDRLVDRRLDFEREFDRLRAEIGSVTVEIRDLLLEVDDMEAAVADAQDVPDLLEDALERESAALESVSATESDRNQLAVLQNASARIKIRQGVFERALSELGSLDGSLLRISERPLLMESWPESAGAEDELAPLKAKAQAAIGHLYEARRVVAATMQAVESSIENGRIEAVSTDQASRDIRKRLDQLEEGVGAITREVEDLREKSGQLAALEQRLAEKRSHTARRVEQRDQLYRTLDDLHRKRFVSRLRVAESLTEQLRPNIDIGVTGSERTRPYAESIVCGLRGSGMHYNKLSQQIAAVMSPLELVQAVESRNPQPIVEATAISQTRAQSVISALRDSDLAKIITAPIEDGVTLKLLDGAVYKNSEQVSIGQRCTTVLPVLLAQHGDILMVDQPEDHLDNSFIASTVVNVLRKRHEQDQLILTSHNANIPVLGDADSIVVLDSDGKRGFVEHAGSLDDKESVQAITDIMEGGAEAFSKRADFYDDLSVRRHRP